MNPFHSDWDRIKSPSEDKIVPYAKLPSGSAQNLNKLAVLKVNGGLGTSMGTSSSAAIAFLPLIRPSRHDWREICARGQG